MSTPDEKTLNALFAETGYKRIRKYSYQASWSNPEVGHYIFLEMWGPSRSFVTADFGLKNPVAEDFSYECLFKYCGSITQLLRQHKRLKTDCSLRFEFARLRTPYKRFVIYTPHHTGNEIAEILKVRILDDLMPQIRDVIHLDVLLKVLLTDREPFRWFVTGPTIRIPQIVSIARRLGWTPADISVAVEPYVHELFRGTDIVDPKNYVANVIRDWDSRSLSQASD